jgi:hypothetical protein
MRPPIHLNSESASGEGREVLLGILFFPYSAARALSNTISVKVAVVDVSRRWLNSLGTFHLGLNGLDNRCANFWGRENPARILGKDLGKNLKSQNGV